MSRTLVSEAANQWGRADVQRPGREHGRRRPRRRQHRQDVAGAHLPGPEPPPERARLEQHRLDADVELHRRPVRRGSVGRREPVFTSLTATLTDEGAGQSGTGTCIDSAGNTASDTRWRGRDRQDAAEPAGRLGRPRPGLRGGGGWFKDVVTVSFAGNGDPDGANGTAGSGVDPPRSRRRSRSRRRPAPCERDGLGPGRKRARPRERCPFRSTRPPRSSPRRSQRPTARSTSPARGRTRP